MFKETLHQISLNILDAPLRNCRPFQEKIVDSYDDGRLKFAWDIIKENYFTKQDQTLTEICQGCTLNIYLIEFGCRGEIYNLDHFINFLSIHLPEATLLKYKLISDTIDANSVQQINQELENFLPETKNILWPVAKVIFNNQPVLHTQHNGSEGPFFYPWSGKKEPEHTFGNEGYQLGISKEGIIVQRNYIQKLPYSFKQIWKKGSKVFGKTSTDDVICFEPQGGLLPAWDKADAERESELAFSSLSVHLVFKDILDTLTTFFKRAKDYNIGLEINQIR